jgi:hypothetical protein
MRLRGLTGARDEFHLAAIVQNLKTMALRQSARQQTECPRRLRKWRMAIRSGCSPAQGSDARPGVTAKPFLNGKANYGRAFFDNIGPRAKSRRDLLKSAVMRSDGIHWIDSKISCKFAMHCCR